MKLSKDWIELKKGEICLQIGEYYECKVLNEKGELADSVCQGKVYRISLYNNKIYMHCADDHINLTNGMQMIHFGVFEYLGSEGPYMWKYYIRRKV